MATFWEGAPIAIAPPSLVSILPDPVGDGVALGDPVGGQLLILQGSNLETTSAVAVGGTAATLLRSTKTQVFALAPAKAVGTYDVVVTTRGGVATLAASYQAWSPLQLAGAWVYDSRFGVTHTTTVTQWNDRAGSGINPAQLNPAKEPSYDAKDWSSPFNPSPGMFGFGTSGGGASGPLLAAAKQALATGKTYFWVAKTLDDRTVGGGQGNVPCSVVGDDAAGGWSGNAGYGGQQGDAHGGEVSLLNWNDTFGGFQRMTWDGPINDGLPHCVAITHSQVNPWPAEAFIDGVRVASGRIAPGLAGVPIVAQATPFHSEYNAGQLGWNALFGGKVGDDDFFNGDAAAVVIVPSVVSGANQTLLYKWGHNTFCFYFYVWEETNAAVPFAPTDGAGLKFLAATGKLYKICGWNGLSNQTVFESGDGGVSWVALADFPGVARHAMPVILHTDNVGKEWIYVAGGDGVGSPGDIWRFDGTTWELVCLVSPTNGVTLMMMFSVGGNLYIFGGQTDPSDHTTALQTVYKSTDDGVTWARIADAPWPARGAGAYGTLPNGDGILVCGGTVDSDATLDTYYNDCWTFNAITETWTLRLANGHTKFPPRRYTTGFVLQGFFWFGDGFGGYNAPATPADNIGDLQFTTDGATWFSYHFTTFGPRHADSWAVDSLNQIAYHGFGIAGDPSDDAFHKFVPVSP